MANGSSRRSSPTGRCVGFDRHNCRGAASRPFVTAGSSLLNLVPIYSHPAISVGRNPLRFIHLAQPTLPLFGTTT